MSYFQFTSQGSLSRQGFSKQPARSPHNFLAVSLHRHSICRTKPHGVSLTNTIGGYFNDKYKSAASRTDSVNVRNFEATVHYNHIMTMILTQHSRTV